jgi:acyl-CoA thioesterase-1
MKSSFAYPERKKTMPAIFTIALALSLFLTALSSGAETPEAADTPKKTLVFLGDSLTAGLGVQPTEAFPAIVADKIRAAGLAFEVQNAGLSGDTSAGGLRRIEWLLQRPIDLLVLELGGNDGLRGQDLKSMKANLQSIIDKTKAKNPHVKIVLAGMQVPPNMGAEYANGFARVYSELAKENDATLIPFLLEGVGGNRELNQPDLIHPSAAGHRVVAELVWRTLEPLLRQP